MAITGLDGYIAAAKQRCPWQKIASRTTVAATWFSVFDLAGNPGAGTLAAANTANGVVPTDATAGYPGINAFGGAAIGGLAKVDFGSTVACRIQLFDRLFLAGAYAFNAAQALSAQPSYAGRLPNTDYKGLEYAAFSQLEWSVKLATRCELHGRSVAADGPPWAATIRCMDTRLKDASDFC